MSKHDNTHVDVDDNMEAPNGTPNKEAWNKANVFLRFLKVFYDVTLQLSSSLTVTAISCFHQITLIQELAENMNPLLIIFVVLDPRYKLAYINDLFDQLFPDYQLCMFMKNKARNTLPHMFEEHSAKIGVETGMSHSVNTLSFFATSNTLSSSGSSTTITPSGRPHRTFIFGGVCVA